jgi:nucleoside-diphosphate-sugar epimerase
LQTDQFTDFFMEEENMRVLVAGGAGYIGSVLVPRLLDHGYDVDVVDLLWFGNNLPLGTTVFQGDLFECTEEDLAAYDSVVFLAGLSNDPMAEFSPSMNFIHNAALPSYLAYSAKKAGVKRFIYASSCSVYGYTENEVYDEDSPVSCSYPYGISKLQGERGVLQLQDENFSTIALRQGTVSGHSPRMRFDLIVNTMFKSAMSEGKITINNASIWRPILDVRDTCHAFHQALSAPPEVSGIFNVASGNFTVGQIGALVKQKIELLMGRKIEIITKNVRDFRNYKVSTERAKKTLDFTPIHSVADIIHGLHAHRNEYGDFSDDRFYNIKVFQDRFMPRKRLAA